MSYLILGYALGAALIGGYSFNLWRRLRELGQAARTVQRPPRPRS